MHNSGGHWEVFLPPLSQPHVFFVIHIAGEVCVCLRRCLVDPVQCEDDTLVDKETRDLHEIELNQPLQVGDVQSGW